MKAVMLGVVAGFVGGLFGVGGGIIVVPALVLFFHIAQYEASATSVAVIVASSAAALASFAGDGAVDWNAAALIFIGAGSGAALGTRYMQSIPERFLTRTIAVVMIVAAIRLAT